MCNSEIGRECVCVCMCGAGMTTTFQDNWGVCILNLREAITELTRETITEPMCVKLIHYVYDDLVRVFKLQMR